MSIFPTNYTDKITLVDWDKVLWYDSETATPNIDWNKNFTLLAIYNYVLATITTSDIPEWTNLYYTEDRVNNNATVSSLNNNAALKSNVLELDNTTPYTPTLDYHPVTKKFLEDKPITQSTTTQIWGNKIATDSEAEIWTDTVKTITSKQLEDKISAYSTFAVNYPRVNASNVVVFQDAWSWGDKPYAKKKEIRYWNFPWWWTIRVSFDLRTQVATEDRTMYWRVYVNWVAVWAEHSTTSSSFTTFTDDIWVSANDLVQIYCTQTTSSWIWNGEIRNFQLFYDINYRSQNPTILIN